MSEYEHIDVVDEQDNIVGTIDRTPEWNKTRPTIFRLVNILVQNDKGEFLLQQRHHTKNQSPLRFDTAVGGLVTSGLSYKEAAQKEMREEFGVEAPLTEITKFTYKYPETKQVRGHHMVYIAHHNGPFSNWEAEAERLEWMAMDEIKHMTSRFPYLFTPGFMRAFEEYLKYTK